MKYSLYHPLAFSLDELNAGSGHIAAWLFLPPAHRVPQALLVCLPGGSYSKAYWHLEVPGYPADAYSFASYMAQRGFAVLALDHLGVGESSKPTNGHYLSVEAVVRANDAVVRSTLARLQQGTLLAGLLPLPFSLPTIGIGHSLGSYVLLYQQGSLQTFDAIAPLGWTNNPYFSRGIETRLAVRLGLSEGDALSEFLTSCFAADPTGYIRIDRTRIRPFFYLDDVPEEVIIADTSAQTLMPAGLLNSMSDPDLLRREIEKIDVPLFLSNGDTDVSQHFLHEPATYPHPDVMVFELASSAHCQNLASTRKRLWLRLALWAYAVTQIKSAQMTY